MLDDSRREIQVINVKINNNTMHSFERAIFGFELTDLRKIKNHKEKTYCDKNKNNKSANAAGFAFFQNNIHLTQVQSHKTFR